MIPKQLKFDRDAREKISAGMAVVAKAVGTTLGPKGQNVAINKMGNPPQIIHDGVGVAKVIDLDDPFEDMGAQLLKDASLQTSKKAGDGTTTSTILAEAIMTEGIEVVAAGMNPMILKNEIDAASDKLVEEIKKLSKPINTLKEKEDVAKISSASKEIGESVAEVVHGVGHNGIINIQESSNTETYIEYKKGLEFNRGYGSPFFINDKETGEVILKNPHILITDMTISRGYEIIPFLEYCLSEKIRDLVIIGDVQEEALSMLVYNRGKIDVNVVSVIPPSHGEFRINELEDIAVLTGGVLISTESGRELKSVKKEELGVCDEFNANYERTRIIGGNGSKVAIEAKLNEIEKSITNASSKYDEEMKKQRLAKLSGSVAIIHVGAVAESELSDKIERFDDAVSATKAAVEEGVVAGGEATLLYLSQQDFWDDTTGAKILREAIKKPFKVLMENSGYDYAEMWGVMTPLKYPYGIDALDGMKKDMLKAGILDPCKVTRLALQNAVSVATMGLTTKVLISEEYEQRS